MAVMETIDRLYGLPLAEFTRARDLAERELRTAGQRDDAERVKALRKPTVAAAAVNRLVREHRDEVERFLRAAAALRDAQFSGKGGLAAARKDEREVLDHLTRLGGERVRQSLLAAAVDEVAARQVLEARLDRELEPRGFGTLLAYAPPAAKPREAAAGTRERPATATTAAPPVGSAPSAKSAPSRPAPPEQRKPDDDAARARLQDAKTALGAAEAEERQARRHWDQTRRELEKARAALDRARRDLRARDS